MGQGCDEVGVGGTPHREREQVGHEVSRHQSHEKELVKQQWAFPFPGLQHSKAMMMKPFSGAASTLDHEGGFL